MSGIAWVLALALVVIGLVLFVALRGRTERVERIEERPPEPLRDSVPVSLRPVDGSGPEVPDVSGGTKYPVVLLHGAFGFEELRIQNESHAYFFGVRDALEAKGIEVHTPEVSPVAGIRTRAKQLVHKIGAIDAPKVNIIAHSMGGLDTRYAITHFGLHDRIASLVTFGTPHHGTPLANLGSSFTASIGIRRLLGHVGEMFRDLATRRMERFNEDTPNHEDVYYASVVGRVKRLGEVHPLLAPTFQWLATRVGDNDGIVPAGSQEWGELLFIVDVDHWAQVGWSRSRSVQTVKIYEAIADALAERGF